MDNVTEYIYAHVDGSKSYQKIDGFGVNINSKYWDDGGLLPVMDLLVDDLGATLYRVDAYGKSNWVDPDGKLGPAALSPEALKQVYKGKDFEYAAEMCRYLNSKGIEPYITLSGVVPPWMCREDGVTLEKYPEFAEMAVSYIKWLREKAGIKFTLFGPLNETDLGPPEGPFVSPEEFVKVCEVLIEKLDENGLGDIRLVVAEQSDYNMDYIDGFLKNRRFLNRIGAFSLHKYHDQSFKEAVKSVAASDYSNCPVWMTEYGDLDQTGEKEWYIAWVSFQRLMEQLEDGMTAAMNWDAYDNYHDHDEAWTIYGIIRAGGKIYTPKKRYYSSKQMYRFVRPGFTRIAASARNEKIHMQAYTGNDGQDLTIIGMNYLNEDVYIKINLSDIDKQKLPKTLDLHVTTPELNCIKVGEIPMDHWLYGLSIRVPAKGYLR